MPVIVIGADTDLGKRIIDALLGRDGEVRAFVTDPDAADRLRAQGVKVAVGDVSDGSHVAVAALNCHSAVLDPEAGRDGRERSFATTPEALAAAWADALADAGVRRAIWLGESVPAPVAAAVAESAAVTRGEAAPDQVRRLDELPAL
jgi:putative NADH-flavin reductase